MSDIIEIDVEVKNTIITTDDAYFKEIVKYIKSKDNVDLSNIEYSVSIVQQYITIYSGFQPTDDQINSITDMFKHIKSNSIHNTHSKNALVRMYAEIALLMHLLYETHITKIIKKKKSNGKLYHKAMRYYRRYHESKANAIKTHSDLYFKYEWVKIIALLLAILGIFSVAIIVILTVYAIKLQ